VVRTNLKHVNAVKKQLADGSVRVHHYYRPTGTRLEGQPGSAEFLRSYLAAEKALIDRDGPTVNALIRKFTASPFFASKAASTQKEYRRMLNKVEECFGTMPLPALEDPDVRQDFKEWQAEVAETSGLREADNRLSVVSTMIEWSIENGLLRNNPIAGFKRLHKADRSELIWQEEHITKFMSAAPLEMQQAMIMALHTGQRQGDLLRLRWDDYVDGFISLRQGKGKRRVQVSVTQALGQTLGKMERRSTVILTTKTGQPWKSDYFKKQWRITSDAAGIQDLHFHDLRGTAVTMLAEAGCTVPQIASITGHSLRSVTDILDRYLARTKGLSSSAMRLFENAPNARFANQLQTNDR
jgi:integrase